VNKKYNSNDIQTLSARDHVRKRPLLYFNDCFENQSLDKLVFEVLCHAFDEYFEGNCSQIHLQLEKDAFTVNYNAGMSLESRGELSSAECIMTKQFACSNQKKHLAVGEKYCGIGMATVHFAAGHCRLETYSNGKLGRFEITDGETSSSDIISDKTGASKTTIWVKPDRTIFKELYFTLQGVQNKIAEITNDLVGLTFTVEHNFGT